MISTILGILVNLNIRLINDKRTGSKNTIIIYIYIYFFFFF